jgi:hypothetical protein
MLYHIVVEPHGITQRPRDSYSFIARRGLSFSPGINQAFIHVYNESPTNVSLLSSLPRCASLPPGNLAVHICCAQQTGMHSCGSTAYYGLPTLLPEATLLPGTCPAEPV